jgi:hypothetical protein
VLKSFATVVGLAACLTLTASAHAGVFKLYSGGDNVVVNTGPLSDPIVFQLTSDTSPGQPGYGGMEYDARGDGLKLSQLTTLSALYQMTTGTFGGGSPRFTLFDNTSNPNNAAYIYWGTPLGGGTFSHPHPGTFGTTGNLADTSSSDIRVYVNGFGGQNTPNTGEIFGQFVAALGNTTISFITLDLDSGWLSKQQMFTDNFKVNGAVFNAASTPEPASLTLLSLGFAGLAGYGMRRRKA